MQRIIVQVPMTKELKDKAETISADLGFSSLQETIRVLLTKLSKKEFRLKVEENNEEPNEYFKRTLEKARKNWKEGKGSPIFRSGKDAVKWLEEQGI